MEEKNLRKGYNGYLLTDQARSDLLTYIEPVHPDVIAHHVTNEFGVYESLPPDATSVRVTAVAQNELVQAAVVKVNGTTLRPDGGTYHITISVDRGAGGLPVDSNRLLDDSRVWIAVEPFNLDVTPEFFSF